MNMQSKKPRVKIKQTKEDVLVAVNVNGVYHKYNKPATLESFKMIMT